MTSVSESKSIIGRLWIVTILVIAILVLFLTRLTHLQLVQGSYYQRLADANRHFKQPIPAERGVILDRYQQPLVRNTKIYFELEGEGLYPKKHPISHQEALELMAEDAWSVAYELRRQYLHPWTLAHTVGYLAPITAEELSNNRHLKVSDWMGRMGLERQFDQVLRGRDGHRLFEVNTYGHRQRLISEKPPEAGQDISTSLDPYLSKILYEALGQMTGAAAVLDVETGQVLALVSKPSFDASQLSGSFLDEVKEAQRLASVRGFFQDKRQVFFHRAIGGAYPPGSVFKMVTAVAGLEVDAFDEKKTVLDEGILRVGEYEYANWLYTARGATDGEIALVRAIARSNDIYFYKAAEWTGPTTLANQARQFGFGSKTGIELPAEAAGLVPDPAWKEQATGERWFLGNTYHFGIGQGDMLTTPLQAAQLVQALAKGGELCKPRLVTDDGKNQWTAEHCISLGLQERSVEMALRGMIAACQPGGTAALLFKYNNGFAPVEEVGNALGMIEAGAVACKTGTSEFGGQDQRGRRRTHGWFVAATSIDRQKLENNLQERLSLVEERLASEEEVFSTAELKQWLAGVQEHGFPRKIALVSLVESDDAIPYKEGSREAAPVVDAVLRYLR